MEHYIGINKCGDLSDLLDKTDDISNQDIKEYSSKAKKRMKEEYEWKKIVNRYENIFI